MRIIIDLKNHDGSRSLSLDGWASVVRSNREETVAALTELIEHGICDTERHTERHASVTPSVTRDAPLSKSDIDCDAKVTLTCRRIVRESKSQSKHALRQERYRVRKGRDANSDASCDARVTGIESEAEADIESEAESSSGVCSSSGGRPTGKKKHPQQPTFPAADFVLTDQLREWAQVATPDVSPEVETEKFRDYYGRNGKTFTNLPAAWRKWMRDAVERHNRARAPTFRRESVAEHNARIFAEIEAEDAAKAQVAKSGRSP
jgi:hypothetical protein